METGKIGRLVDTDFSFINSAVPANADSKDQYSSVDVHIAGEHTILVVDDNITTLEVMTDLLRECGYDVCPVAKSSVALAVFARHAGSIPLVIMDECMPGMSGHELLQQIHRISPGTRVILSSGYFADDMRGPDLDSSYAVFLQKPFSLERLREVVENCFASLSPGLAAAKAQ